jgi:hypothetical protein
MEGARDGEGRRLTATAPEVLSRRMAVTPGLLTGG